MAPPAAGEASSSSSACAAAPETPHPHPEQAAKPRCRPSRPAAGAWARVVSMGVQGCVMAAALALFLLFAFAACLLMMALVFSARAFRRQGSRYRPFSPDHDFPPPPPPPPRPVGLAPAQIARLPCFDSSPFDGPSTCVVCLEPSRAGQRWRKLPPCGHAFHAACVDPWLRLSPACPVCRAAVAVPPEKS
ncbi:uncharacterized protein [Lolium perenne]|uniref:uncharacterized protein n=1 Tax=Lolium perenne TaxID=4522 RepID=UPI0021EA3A5E|nr:RING-H2 finger protein ATL39-like [Lolium perenne]